MGHGKETPRQKMIGMMYLVLTAMLALNVSKEAVEAFKKVDQGLTKTVANYEIKNNLTYEDFERAFSENEVKAGPWRSKAVELNKRADELFDYLQDIKIEIIKEAEGEETLAVNGREVDIEHVEKIDENNIPSQILIGDDENGKANDIRALIDDYREFLIETVDGGNVSVEQSVLESLDTSEGKAPDGTTERWEDHTFYHLPLVAVITILSKLQVDVRNSETDVLNYLYNQIDASSYKFNKLVPTVIASNYVMRGNSYNASVFIAATDTTKKPDIYVGRYDSTINADGTKSYQMVGDYETLDIDDQGRGIYSKPATSVGDKPWGGLINMSAPDGSVVSYPFKSAYTVGAPNVVVSPTAMNVLYVGIDNPIDISVPGVGSDAISASMSNGNIKRGRLQGYRGEWVASPTTVGQDASVNVRAVVNGERMSFPPYKFRVKGIPAPITEFAGKTTDAAVPKAQLLVQPGVFAVQPDFLFDLKYTVTKFTVIVVKGGFDRVAPSTNNRITADQKALIQGLSRGQKLYLTDVWAVGPDKKQVQINSLILTVQ